MCTLDEYASKRALKGSLFFIYDEQTIRKVNEYGFLSCIETERNAHEGHLFTFSPYTLNKKITFPHDDALNCSTEFTNMR